MAKKFFVLTVVLFLLAGISAIAFAADTAVASTTAADESGPSVRVGGWLKMWIFDRPAGIGKDVGAGKQIDITKSYGVSFNEFDLILNVKCNDLVSFLLEPNWSSSTGATPKLGQVSLPSANPTVPNGITQTSIAASNWGHGVAEMILNLPQDITLEVGALRPHFSMDYGEELFFDEEMTTGKATHDLMVLEDYGFGVAKSFTFGDLSLPVNLYILGGADGDFKFENNNQPGVMLHVEPHYGPVELYGSFFASRWDDKERYAKTKGLFGINVSWEGLTLRSEFARDRIENKVNAAAGIDKTDEGYYVKLFYRVLPWLQFMIHHDSALEGASTGPANRGKTTRYLTNTIAAEINLSDSTILQVNCEVGDWRTNNNDKSVVYTRPNIAVRSSF